MKEESLIAFASILERAISFLLPLSFSRILKISKGENALSWNSKNLLFTAD
jgi:hypothetical protein